MELPEPCSHSIQLIRPFARTNIYFNSFFPRTISDWNKLHITTLTNVSIEEFKDILVNFFLYISVFQAFPSGLCQYCNIIMQYKISEIYTAITGILTYVLSTNV